MSADVSVVQLAGVDAYPSIPQISATYWPDLAIYRLEAGDGCWISFDGVSDHVQLMAADPPLTLPLRYSKIWFRRDGTANPTTLRVFLSNHGLR